MGTGTANSNSDFVLGSGGGSDVTETAGIRFQIQFLSISGTPSVILTPVDNSLTWAYRLANVNGPAEISCDFALTETDDGTPEGTPLITPDCFAPYAYDFQLLMSVDTEVPVILLDGIVTGVNLPVDGGLSASNGQPRMS